MRTNLRLALVLMGCAAGGCAHTGFVKTTDAVVPARSPGCHLDMVFQGLPPYRYAVLGEVSTYSTAPGGLFGLGENEVAAIRRMQEEACVAGAHGLMSVVATSHRPWPRKGMWSTTGAAMAFIYVDAFGRPLPPPGPRVLIQPGVYAAAVGPGTPAAAAPAPAPAAVYIR